jgi:hypothetical protein
LELKRSVAQIKSLNFKKIVVKKASAGNNNANNELSACLIGWQQADSYQGNLKTRDTSVVVRKYADKWIEIDLGEFSFQNVVVYVFIPAGLYEIAGLASRG